VLSGQGTNQVIIKWHGNTGPGNTNTVFLHYGICKDDSIAITINKPTGVVAGDVMIVSPDVGGVVRARAIAKQLNDSDLAIIDKRRPEANKSEVMHIIGDVKGRTCILVDDIVDTAGTLCAAASALKSEGAVKVVAYCTHAVLSGKAIDNIRASELDELVVTDTIPLSQEAQSLSKIRQLSIAEELAESIRRISNEESLSALFAKRIQSALF
jgi:ribose-phosphate pyrophosphokinase